MHWNTGWVGGTELVIVALAVVALMASNAVERALDRRSGDRRG